MTYRSPSPKTPVVVRLRNQRTQAYFRRDVAWQIAAPLALAGVAAMILMVLVVLPTGAPSRSAWADVSLILLIIPAAVLGLVMLAVLAGLIWLLRIGLREVPFIFKRIQDWGAVATYRVQRGARSVANVFLSWRSFWAGAHKVARDVRAIIPVRRHG